MRARAAPFKPPRNVEAHEKPAGRSLCPVANSSSVCSRSRILFSTTLTVVSRRRWNPYVVLSLQRGAAHDDRARENHGPTPGNEEQIHLLLHETKTGDAVPRDRVEGLARLASEARKLIK